MKKTPNWNIGLCSWSLANDLELINQVKKQTSVSTMHLFIPPIQKDQNIEYINNIKQAGWKISSGMIAFDQEDYSTLDSIKKTGGILPDKNWPENKKKVCNALDVLEQVNIPYLSFHFGFIEKSNTKMAQRVKMLCDCAASKNITLLMETGQETPQDLLEFLQIIDSKNLAVNFDPANMILYGKGDPVKSIDILSRHIKHIHLKDAQPSPKPGQWGTEVPWSKGQVNSTAFFEKLTQINYSGSLCVEREQGKNRQKDIISAISIAQDFIKNKAQI